MRTIFWMTFGNGARYIEVDVPHDHMTTVLRNVIEMLQEEAAKLGKAAELRLRLQVETRVVYRGQAEDGGDAEDFRFRDVLGNVPRPAAELLQHTTLQQLADQLRAIGYRS